MGQGWVILPRPVKPLQKLLGDSELEQEGGFQASFRGIIMSHAAVQKLFGEYRIATDCSRS